MRTFFLLLLLSGASYISQAKASNALEATNNTFIQGVLLGTALGFLFISLIAFFMSKKYRRDHKNITNELTQTLKTAQDTESARLALLEELQDSQDTLEDRVQERTISLNIALQELENANHELEKINTLDALSGLYNRRFYDQKILAEYRRSKRNLTSLSLVIIDIDHFKKVNDTYGHIAGDKCLVWLSDHIKKSLKRSADLAFRYGGEEFCLILPDTDAKGAASLAENLRKNVEIKSFTYDEIEISLTISCGISTYQQENHIHPEQMFISADKALYKAKSNGRNQVQHNELIEEII